MSEAKQRYLKDRRTGELYGYTHEMAKLKYMQVVNKGDAGWDDGKPDPDYHDPDAKVELAKPVIEPDHAPGDVPDGTHSTYVDLDEDRKQTEREALEDAARRGRDELDGDEPAPFNEHGHAFLGYDADDQPVYETDEERDARQKGDQDQKDAIVKAQEDNPPAEGAKTHNTEPEPEPQPTTRKRSK